MAQVDHMQVLTSIRDQQSTMPLSILTLSEPILSNLNVQTRNGVLSESLVASTTESPAHDAHLTPVALAADLEHYQSLFSKLRFSYLEQVTKEKYLRSIVGDPPVLVTQEDNTALEEELVGMKSELKAKKEAVNQLVKEMEVLAQSLAQQLEEVNASAAEVERLGPENEELETQITQLRAQLKEKEDDMDVDVSDDPQMNLSLQETDDLLSEQQRQIREVDEQIASLQRDMPSKIRECERMERELGELDTKKNEVTKQARELQRIREEGGRDTLEEQGRWLKSSETVLKGLLGIKT